MREPGPAGPDLKIHPAISELNKQLGSEMVFYAVKANYYIKRKKKHNSSSLHC